MGERFVKLTEKLNEGYCVYCGKKAQLASSFVRWNFSQTALCVSFATCSVKCDNAQKKKEKELRNKLIELHKAGKQPVWIPPLKDIPCGCTCHKVKAVK